MQSVWLNIALIVGFVILGGFFAAAEIALVSLRDSQIRAIAHHGKRGQTVARVARDPNRFLSAVQIGVTLMGFLSAAFGGATLAADLAPVLLHAGLSTGWADIAALVAITLVISYVSIVLGELVAKRLALQRAEVAALLLAPSVDRIATALRPVIWLLGRSTDVVLRLLGSDPTAQRERMSDDELRDLVSSHETLTDEERKIVEEVFAAGDRQIREVMIPRTEVDFMDASLPVFKAAAFASERPHSRYPVIRGSSDDVIGFLHVRDLFQSEVSGRSVRVGEIVRDMLMLPGTREVLPALADMRREGVHLAIVVDEYGGTAGIVTMEDLVEELIGDIRDEYDADPTHTQRFVGGEVEVDGLLNLQDFEDETGLELPDGPYETVAGFITAALGRLPGTGDACEVDGYRLRVVAMDGRRIERVRVSAVAE
ncbi:MAG: hemolysin family protein [Actinomycetota bacterium]|nr:hemolysin family protein [Actinomycetota bacterium]